MIEKKMTDAWWSPAVGRLVELALEEDLGRGDVTTEATGSARRAVSGRVVARQDLRCCGLPLLGRIVGQGAPAVSCITEVADGDQVTAGAVLARLDGPAGQLLGVERVVLNFLMRLSGVATLTGAFVDAVAGTSARIVDTRKTLPGWRALDKYAVRVGGGVNHRFDLGSGLLIKDNHLVVCGSVVEAVRRARAGAPHCLRVEVEVDTLDQLDEALGAGAEVVLLDNMTPDQVRQAVARVGGRALVEVSGGVTLQTVRDFAEAGADLISVGALTHSAPAVDLALELDVE